MHSSAWTCPNFKMKKTLNIFEVCFEWQFEIVNINYLSRMSPFKKTTTDLKNPVSIFWGRGTQLYVSVSLLEIGSQFLLHPRENI